MTRRIAFLFLVTAVLSFGIGATLAGLSDSGTANGEITAGSWDSPEGCSHGFWKTHEVEWTVFTPGDMIEDVFDVPDEYGLDGDTLGVALDYSGGSGDAGGAQILLKQAVAAVLNAEHPEIDYSRSVEDVIAAVNSALASGDRGVMEALAAELEADNDLGCPL